MICKNGNVNTLLYCIAFHYIVLYRIVQCRLAADISPPLAPSTSVNSC